MAGAHPCIAHPVHREADFHKPCAKYARVTRCRPRIFAAAAEGAEGGEQRRLSRTIKPKIIYTDEAPERKNPAGDAPGPVRGPGCGLLANRFLGGIAAYRSASAAKRAFALY